MTLKEQFETSDPLLLKVFEGFTEPFVHVSKSGAAEQLPTAGIVRLLNLPVVTVSGCPIPTLAHVFDVDKHMEAIPEDLRHLPSIVPLIDTLLLGYGSNLGDYLSGLIGSTTIALGQLAPPSLTKVREGYIFTWNVCRLERWF